MHPLLDRDAIDVPPSAYLSAVGTVFAQFDQRTQDSGNVSFGVRIGAARYFVKTAGSASDTSGTLPHAARIALLRNAMTLSRCCRHAALTELLRVIESPDGPCLVYPWLDGELLGVPRAQRADPGSPFQRFRRLPAPTVARGLETIFDLHAHLARAGWTASDFYDGSLLYDFTANRMYVIDLDHYRAGPFVNEMGRMFGSARFMAPEEFTAGACIDERTTVFVMGRTALVLLGDGTLDASAFRGSPARLDVVARACDPAPSRRYSSVSAFYDAWRAAGPG